MHLLASTDIALRVLILLAGAPPGRPVSVGWMARELGGLSRDHLHKIVQELTGLGITRTVRGAGGAACCSPGRQPRCAWEAWCGTWRPTRRWSNAFAPRAAPARFFRAVGCAVCWRLPRPDSTRAWTVIHWPTAVPTRSATHRCRTVAGRYGTGLLRGDKRTPARRKKDAMSAVIRCRSRRSIPSLCRGVAGTSDAGRGALVDVTAPYAR